MVKRSIAIFTLTLSFSMLLFAGMQLSETRSAPNPGTENYNTSLSISTLDIMAVDEKGNEVKELLSSYSGKETLELGMLYPEYLAAENIGRSDEYVRAIVRKYWTDIDGNKVTKVDGKKKGEDGEVITVEAIDPEYIILEGTDASWQLDDSTSARETKIYYWKNKLAAGDTTGALMTGIQISKNVRDYYEETIEETENSKTITVTYLYDNLKLNLEIEIQSVQANENAIRSIWGVDYLSVEGDTLKINGQGGSNE